MSASESIALSRRGHFVFSKPPAIASCATVAGRKEAQGPLGAFFDRVVRDETMGETSYERAERKLFASAVDLALGYGRFTAADVDLLVAGDLLDQITTVNFGARDVGIPLLGVYSACSTSSEALLIAALSVSSGAAQVAVAATASHHLAAERQYRYPIELAVQRPPTAQWTATGSAAFALRPARDGEVTIVSATVGRVRDLGLKDPNNMGAAMAPAAADTIVRHLRARDQTVRDYDLILTGDLGRVGHPLLAELLEEESVFPQDRLADAGIMLYDEAQDVHAGGSGAACSALVFGSTLLPRLRRGEIRRLLVVATGSLHSPRTYQQGETIPAIAHAVELEATQ